MTGGYGQTHKAESRTLLNPAVTTTSVQLPLSICGVSVLGFAGERVLIEAFGLSGTTFRFLMQERATGPTGDHLTSPDDVLLIK